MPTLIDLTTQVQGILPVLHGGTGNEYGYARDCLFVTYVNGTGGTLTRKTLVTVPNGSGDAQLGKTTVANQVNVTGVIVGRISILAGEVGLLLDEDVDDGEFAAVAIVGHAWVDVEAAVAVGDYAYAANTDGKAKGASVTEAQKAAFGMFESATSGSGQAFVRLFGSGPIGQPTQTGAIVCSFGDGLTNLLVGTSDHVRVPYACTITKMTMLSHQSGTIVIDIYKDTYANYPPTGSDSITAAATPTITAGIKAEDSTLTGWTTMLAKDDILRFEVESITGGVYQVEIELYLLRTG